MYINIATRLSQFTEYQVDVDVDYHNLSQLKYLYFFSRPSKLGGGAYLTTAAATNFLVWGGGEAAKSVLWTIFFPKIIETKYETIPIFHPLTVQRCGILWSLLFSGGLDGRGGG